MQFVYPGFLFALSALSIPIIIHLFNFRRFRRIAFTNVRFLQEIKQDTRSRSRLKHLLILIARLLAITFLVLAFAQPLIPAGKKAVSGGVKNIGIYIDNSFSMDAIGKNGSLLETAKRKAREIAGAYQPSDHFQLLTNDFEARHQRLVNREELLQMIDEVQPGASVKSLSEVITRQTDAMRNQDQEQHHITLYEISDFQKSISDFENLKNDTTLQVNLVPVSASAEKNIFIDSCFLKTPFVQLNTPNELTVSIANISDADAESVPVKLFINGTQRSLTSISIPAGTTAETKLTFSVTQPGWQQAQVSISDYPVVFDDTYYLSFEVKEHLDVLSINEVQPSPYVNALFGSDPYFVLKNTLSSQVDYASFPSHNLIILNNLKTLSSGLAQELKKYLLQGGAVVLFPAAEINPETYQDFCRSVNVGSYQNLVNDADKVTFIEKKSPLFSDVFEKKGSIENSDYPAVARHYTSSGGSREAQEVLMRLQSGDPFFTARQVEKGMLYMCYSPLDDQYSGFPRHALFVPVMLKAAMSGFNSMQVPQRVGNDAPVEIPALQLSGENLLHLTNKDDHFDVIPETRLLNNKPDIVVHDQVKKSGNYSLTSDGKLVSIVSFNFDRRESNLSCYSHDELLSLAEKSGLQTLSVVDSNKELTHAIAEENNGIRLWKYCIWLALIFLGCEVLLIRFMSTSKKLTAKPNASLP